MGEGRTHKVIAENMFDGAKVTPGDDYNIFTERIKRGWSNKPNYGWSELWGPVGFVGGGVEYGIGLLTGAAGVLGEVVSGGYGDAKDFVKSFSAEKNFNSSATNDYIRNISKDDDELLKRLYKGERVASETNANSYLTRQYKEAERDVNTRIEDVIEAQNNLKNGRLLESTARMIIIRYRKNGNVEGKTIKTDRFGALLCILFMLLPILLRRWI